VIGFGNWKVAIAVIISTPRLFSGNNELLEFYQ